MYGIVDFEEKLEKISPAELAPHLCPELGRIPWQRERDEFMPKLLKNQKFVYKGDLLSDSILEQQQRAQDSFNRLKNKFAVISRFYGATLTKIEDRFDDRDLFPTLGLASISGLIAWKGNNSSRLPIRMIFTVGGITITSLLTHRKLRNHFQTRISELLAAEVKEVYLQGETAVGQFGANIWGKMDDLIKDVKNKVVRKM